MTGRRSAIDLVLDMVLSRSAESQEQVARLQARLSEAEGLLEQMVDHFHNSVAAVPTGYGGNLVASARAFIDRQKKEGTND